MNARPKSVARVLLGRARLELERDAAIIPNHPGVVPGHDLLHVARSQLKLGAVLMNDAHRARLNKDDVMQPACIDPDHGSTHCDYFQAG